MAPDWHEEEDQPRSVQLGVWGETLKLAWPYRWHAVALGGMAIVIAFCEVLFPYLTGRIVDAVTQPDGQQELMLLVTYYLATSVGICLGIFGFILLAGRIASGTSYEIRLATFRKLQELPFSYYDRQPVGWIMSRLTSDCDRVSRIIGWTLLDFLWATTMIIGIVVVMLYQDWQLALVVLTVVPPLAGISLYFQRRLLSSARAVRRANAEITAAFNESIMGVRTTKSLVREAENLGEFQHQSTRMFEHCVRNALDSALFVPLVIALGSVMSGLALWYGGGMVLSESMTLGTLITFMNYAGLLFHPIQELARQLMDVQMAQAAAERIQVLLRTVPEIRDSGAVLEKIAAQAADPKPGVAEDGGPKQINKVEFENVSFSYDGKKQILDSFSLDVRAGETIALVGSTGGGKTTIASLLCRFYEPQLGRVLLDGIDYRERSLHWLQSKLGMVLQTPHLFSGSIQDNIRYGRLSASDEEVKEAARTVNAHGFIEQLEDGYASQVGEGGNRLSTGQKQLVALSRAILADPQLFVLDEATSSVDTETEKLIEEGIERVLKGRISFVIAHRLSTIRRADRILVIEDGQIAESGSHESLLARRGRYFDLHARQFSWNTPA